MNRNVRWLTISGGIRATGLSLALPFLILYLRNVLGISYVEVGILVAITGIVPLLIGPFAGLLTDRVGRRRVFFLALGLEAASFFGLAESMQMRSLVIVLGLWSAVQVVGNIGGPAISAYIADFAHGSERTMGYTWVRIGWNVGFTFGVLFGGVLIGLTGFVSVAVIAGGILLVGLAVGIASLDPSPYDLDRRRAAADPPGGVDRPRAATTLRSFRILARDRPFLGLCFAVAIAELTIGQWSTTFPLYVNSVLGIPYAILGAGFALNGLVVVFGQAPMTRAALGRRHTSVLVLGIAAYAIGFLLFGIDGQYALALVPMLFAVVFVLTLGENLTSIPMTTLPSNLAPPSEIGAYNGVFSAIIGVGYLLAPVMGGAAIAASPNPIVVWSLLVAPAIPACALLFLYVVPRLGREANTA